jgi:aminoglycoside 6'-N-acetyltransferase I
MIVRKAAPKDAEAWEQMRQSLWPSSPGEHAREIAQFFEGALNNLAEVLIAFDDTRTAIGLAELSIRPYAEGCYSGRVAYLEGWFVSPAARRHGVGAALVAHAEAWARTQGCTEFGSDCELDNVVSATAHRALGFEEVTRSICFRKTISG